MSDENATTARDYRDTVFLPDTAFPMRAGLPQKEPEILAKWAADDLYGSLRKDRQARGAVLRALATGARPADDFPPAIVAGLVADRLVVATDGRLQLP
jgi:hypothetical protein